MSEILGKQSENVENAGGERTEWEDLAEGQGEVDWGSVAEVEYAGAREETERGLTGEEESGEQLERLENGGEEGDEAQETAGGLADELAGKLSGELAGKVERLRGWIDLDAIAAREDPEGLEAAEQECAVRQGRLDDCRVALAEQDGRYAEIEARQETLPGEIAQARHELELFERKEGWGIMSGVKKALGVGAKKQAELEAAAQKLEEERDELRREQREIEEERKSLEQTVASVDVTGPKQEFLEKFETPLTPEEKKEGLELGALAELSTEEYLRLWRRLNPFFVTHVTRQGIRDHSGMFYHSAGMGEFQEGMTGVLEDGKVLRTPAEVRLGLGRELTEENVGKALDKMLFSIDVDIEGMRARGMSDGAIANELVEGLPVNNTIAAAEPWADRRAVHFGQLTVLDEYYGGETGNEAFFVFPTDVVASQCRFGGHIRNNLTTAEVDQERKWNDMFVWPEGEDLTIDAGLTFLPKGTMVDPETGSKYATKVIEVEGRKVRVPEVDEEAVEKFADWAMGLAADDEGLEAANGLNGWYDRGKLREEALAAGVSERIVEDLMDGMSGFEQRLKGFAEGKDLSDTMWMIPEETLAKMTPEERRRESVRHYLEGNAATFKLAEKAVPAEEYWEGYFAKHPGQRPAHIIYYDGDPSGAVIGTLKEAGVLEDAEKPYGAGNFGQEWQRWTGKGDSHERDGEWLGFEENRVVDMREDEAMRAEHEKFNEMAKKLVAEHYGLEVGS